jgi:hypothetical protein
VCCDNASSEEINALSNLWDETWPDTCRPVIANFDIKAKRVKADDHPAIQLFLNNELLEERDLTEVRRAISEEIKNIAGGRSNDKSRYTIIKENS